MRSLTALVYALSLRGPPALGMLIETYNIPSSVSLYQKNCQDNVITIINTIKSAITPLTSTIVIDLEEEFTNTLLLSLFVILGAVQVSTSYSIPSNINIIFTESDWESETFDEEFWKPAYYYLFFMKNHSLNDKRFVSELWDNYRVYNVFLATCDRDYLVSYNPILKEMENIPINDVQTKKILTTRFYNWKKEKFFFIYPGELELHSSKKGNVPLKMRSYDESIVMVISDKLNVTLDFLATGAKEQFGTKDKNGTYFGTYKWLANGSAYMTCASHFLKWDILVSDIPFSHFITMDKLCFTVPAVGQVPHFKALLRMINISVMASILLMFFITGFIHRFLRKLASKTGLKKNLTMVNITLTIVSILLGMSFHSKIQMAFEKIIIGSLLLMNFVITSTVQSILTTVLSKPVYNKKVESKEELVHSGVEIWSSSKDIVHDLMTNGYSGVNFKLKKPNTISTGFSVGWLEPINIMLETKYFKYRDNGNYFTKECPVTYSMVHFYNKGLPCQKRINQIISVLIESGHIVRWAKQTYQVKEKNLMYKKVKIVEPAMSKGLTLADMKYIFVFFCSSLILSGVVFVMELTYSFTSKNIKRIKINKKVSKPINR